MNVIFKSAILILFIALFSCNDDITVGSTLLDDADLTVEVINDIALKSKTLEGSPVSTQRSTTRESFLLGAIDDPVFGQSSADLYLSVQVVDDLFPEFDTLSIDSVVMILPLESNNQVGADNALHNFKVYQLSETFRPEAGDSIFSDQTLAFDPIPLADVSKTISFTDSLNVYSTSVDSIIQVVPQIRIPLDETLWNQIASDTIISRDDDVFKDVAKGFLIQSTPGESSMLGIDLSYDVNVPVVALYYSANDTTDGTYFFQVGNLAFNHFAHDYSGTSVETAITTESSDLVYIQGMAGPSFEVDIENVLDYSDRLINQATLTVFVEKDSDEDIALIQSLIAQYENEEGDTVQIFDSENRSSVGFDGIRSSIVISGETVHKYDFVITNHIQSLIKGDISNTKIFLDVSGKSETAQRSIIYGPDHDQYPMILKLVVSNP